MKSHPACTDARQTIRLDGKALVVSPVSQDRDARIGHVPGGMGRGYKLHAAVAGDGKVAGFAVLPLNRHETPVARELIDTGGLVRPSTLVFADGKDRRPDQMERLYRRRDQVERVFGNLTCIPGMLGPLPAFVRGLVRVHQWVTAKINLYHARIDARRMAKTG